MNTRIKLLRLHLNLKQSEFGNIIGLKSSISEIENGKAPITERTIIAICSQFNVNQQWLRTGEGEMFNVEKKFDEFFEIYSKLKSPLQDYIIKCIKHLLDIQELL